MKCKIVFLFTIFILTGCISRGDADARLSRGCAAAAELFIDNDFKIKTIKSSKFKPSSEFGSGYREVILFAIESDDWMDVDKEYKCVFAEEMGLFGSSHRASIYQVKVNDEIYGMDGDKIIGDMATHLKLNETVERAMTR